MHVFLLVFEFLGTTELMVIALVALIIFGPRKLPEIGRTLGRSLAEFKRASDDFKRTWEYEVEIEQRKPALTGAHASAAGEVSEASADVTAENVDAEASMSSANSHEAQSIARTSRFESNDPWKDGSALPEGDASEDELNAS
jgi:sec-independent protein translocase protein TatA